MKEYKNLSIFLACALGVCLVIYYGMNTNKPAQEEIYDTSKLSPQKKTEFIDSVNTGDAYVYYGDNKKAVEEFEKAQQLNPVDRQTLYRLASSQHNSAMYEEAEKTLEKLERMEKNNADFWNFRAANIHKDSSSLKNILLAVKYIEKAYSLAKYKDSWMFLKDRAEIYFEAYKYYKTHENIAEQEKFEQKFLSAMQDLKTLAEQKHDSFILQNHDDLYSQYNAFPDGQYESIYDNMPELGKMEYSQEDIDAFKKNMPQRNFPNKKY